MALEFRRGTYAQLQGITPASGEPIWTTDTQALYVGDGVTPGGIAVSGSGGITGTYVSSIIAGDNISINTSSGAVTITATGGGGSTSTYTDLTVLETLTLGPYAAGGNTVNLSVTQDSNQKLLINNADVILDQALEVSGNFIVSSNGIQSFNAGDVIPVKDQMSIIGQGTDIVDFLNSGTFFHVPVTASTATVNRIIFSDSTVQTTAYTGGGGSASTSSLNISTTWGPTSAQLLEASSFGAYGTATVFRMYDPGGTIFGNIGLVASSAGFSNQPVFTMVNPSGPVVFTANASSSGTYAFTTSGLKFPNGTYQTTAYTGPVTTSTLYNGSYTATLDGSGNLNANMFLASEGNTGNSGYSFQNDGGFDTGMFSTGDGVVQFFANNQEVFNFSASSLQLNKSLDANNQEIDRVNQITFNDTSVQNTAFTGDLRINGTWLKNKDTGDIYISPQDGNTGAYFPSDSAAGSQPVYLFNTDTTGTVQIRAGGNIWTFDSLGQISFPNNTTVANTVTGQLTVSANVTIENTLTVQGIVMAQNGISLTNGATIQNTATNLLELGADELTLIAGGQTVPGLRITPGDSALNTNQFIISDEGANTQIAQFTDSAVTFTPPVVANAGLTIGNGSPGLTFGDSTVQTTAWTGSANIFTATTLVQSAQFQASNGASQTTGYSFYTETDQATGMYSTGDQDLEFYTDGNLVMQASTSSLNIALPILFADSTVQTTAYTGTVASTNVTGLATVATTGQYSDLSGQPATNILSTTTTWGPASVQLLEASSFGAYGTATVFRMYDPGGSIFGNIGLVASSSGFSNQPVLTMVNPNGPIVFTANASSSGTFAFTNTGLKFPNNSYQTVAYPGRSLFAQGKLSGDQTIPNGTDTTLQFQATNDPNGWINGSYQFNPTISGWYEITLTVLFDVDGTNTDTGQINAQIISNGTNQQLILQDQVNVNQPKTLSGTVVVLMNGSSDYVAFTVYTSATTSQDILGNQGTYFTARLV